MAEVNEDRDAGVVIVDGVRYRKEEAPKVATSAPNKARGTASGSGSQQAAAKAAAEKAAAEKAAAEKAAAEKAAAEKAANTQ